MTKVLEDKRTMLTAILTLLLANLTKITQIAGFMEAVNFFQELLEKIDAKANEKDDATTGKTAVKHAAEEALIAAIMKASAALLLLARKTKNLELKEKANIQESALTRMRDTDLAAKGKAALDLIKQYATELASIGVTAEEITGLEAKINAYSNAIGKSVSSVSERKGARETLESLVKEADEVLAEEIDNYMERIRDVEPEFYAVYCDARYIRATGVRHKPETPSPTNPPTEPPTK